MCQLKCFVFGLLLTFSCNLSAQKIAIYKGQLMLNMCPSIIRDSTIIDTAKLSLKYRFTNFTQDKDSIVWCNLLLQIGSRVVKQQDLVMYYSHMINTNREVNSALSRKLDTEGTRVSNLYSEFYCDRQTGLMNVVSGDFFDRNKMKDYVQQMPEIKWTLRADEKQVCGYRCFRAVGTYGGREWSVWYTTEIPYAYGPWKLNGLPGMILHATDHNYFSFECVEIMQRAAPIVRYQYNSMQHVHNLETFLRYERRCYDHPYETFAEGGMAFLYVSGADGHAKAIDDSYKVPHIPIELESGGKQDNQQQ